MSGSITFRHGPFQGWQLMLLTRWDHGQMVHGTVQITTPEDRTGILGFRPGIDGWEQTWAAAISGTPAAMAALLEWIVEATAVALDRRTDLDAASAVFWRDVVAEADDSRAGFFARHPDGRVPAFATVTTLAYGTTGGELVAA